MKPFLLETGGPEAGNCVLLGRVSDQHVASISRFRHVLWFVDEGGLAMVPTALERADTVFEASLLERTPIDEVPQMLETLIERDPRSLPAICVTPDVLERCGETYEAVLAQIRATLDGVHRARVTRQADGFVWQKHVLMNLPAYVSRRLPAAWAGALQGLPACVCGAGPSLDVSLPALCEIADGAVVFSADSALRALARRGVQADLAVSIDAYKLPGKCLPPDGTPTRVVLSSVSPPGWREALPLERCLFLSSRQVTEDWLNDQGVARTVVAATENCGSTALELARFLGCAPIYLFGLDLATAADKSAPRRNFDADTSIYRDPAGSPADLPKVPGNYESEVPTHVIADWHALDARLADWPPDLVFNVTDRGARLRNTMLVHPRNLAAVRAPFAKRSALNRLPSPEPGDGAAVRAACEEIGALGTQGCRAVASIRQLLPTNGTTGAVAALRARFAEGGFARVMGAFSLKIMPHLCTPEQMAPDFLCTLIDELEDLCCLAEGFYDVGAE